MIYKSEKGTMPEDIIIDKFYESDGYFYSPLLFVGDNPTHLNETGFRKSTNIVDRYSWCGNTPKYWAEIT